MKMALWICNSDGVLFEAKDKIYVRLSPNSDKWTVYCNGHRVEEYGTEARANAVRDDIITALINNATVIKLRLDKDSYFPNEVR